MFRKFMFVALLFMVIGFASISTNLYINGSSIVNYSNDFYVYFSDSRVDGSKDLSVIESDTQIKFYTVMKTLDEDYVLEYDVTNSSKNYDADITVSCTQGDEYLSVTNVFDSSTPLGASETRTGKLTLSLSKSYLGTAKEINVSCEIVANEDERTELGDDVDRGPASNPYKPGTKVTMGGENFYITGSDSSKVYVLAEFPLTYSGGNYFQADSATTYDNVVFSTTYGWEYTPGPKEIDIETYAPNVAAYLNGYESYLKQQTGQTVTADLLTLIDLKKLGCAARIDYNYSSTAPYDTCTTSNHVSWLYADLAYWLKSASSATGYQDGQRVWSVVSAWNMLYDQDAATAVGVRPVIAISQEYADQLLGI